MLTAKKDLKAKSENDAIALLVREEVCKLLGVSVWTLRRWLAQHSFPPPIYLTPGSHARWRLKTIEAFVEKRARARRVKPTPRGRLKQNA